MKNRTRNRGLLFLVLTTAMALGSSFTVAQTRPHHTAPTSPRRPKADGGAPADAAADPLATSHAEVVPPQHDGGAHGTPGKDVLEAKTLDGGGKVFRFGEVDIEGRLKSPQLVYFLRRVRAEFAAGDLGHRSFLREMSDTRRDPSF